LRFKNQKTYCSLDPTTNSETKILDFQKLFNQSYCFDETKTKQMRLSKKFRFIVSELVLGSGEQYESLEKAQNHQT